MTDSFSCLIIAAGFLIIGLLAGFGIGHMYGYDKAERKYFWRD